MTEGCCRPDIAGVAKQYGYVATSCAHFTKYKEPEHQVLRPAGQLL